MINQTDYEGLRNELFEERIDFSECELVDVQEYLQSMIELPEFKPSVNFLESVLDYSLEKERISERQLEVIQKIYDEK